MALAHLVLTLSSSCCRFGNGVLEERRRALALALGGAASPAGKGIGRVPKGLVPEAGARSSRLEVSGRGRLKVTQSPTVENGQIRTGVDIPVTCYQILGVPEQAEKDEIVKSAMELKSLDIEDGYTADVIVTRQDLLMDVRDKLLFEAEYAGNIREKVPPKSSLRIPWAWLPAALCLLQEVGEEKLVLEIGRAYLQHSDAKPYVHDLLLSMALAECSIAKISLEKSKVSEGFEALARAQYLLRSKISLGKMPLLSQIEESLEELAPACTLELLGMPHTGDNAERRQGAIAALRELLRQGLDVEATCRVQDWPCFLSQSLNKLMATEIVDLLSWDTLAITRKNKKSLESQNQRVIIDFSCFYMAMIAHIALGFSSRQIDMISKARTLCECLIASEGMDLKFEEAFCSLLLGQGGEAVAAEKLRQLEVHETPVLRRLESSISNKEAKDKGAAINQLLETWLKDAVLGVFPDTRDCSPSLANFFGGPKRILSGGKRTIATAKKIPSLSRRSPSFDLSPDHGASKESSHMNSTRYLGGAVKQLAPADLQSQLIVGKTIGNTSGPSVQLKRNLGLHHTKIWESWCSTGDIAGRIAYVTLIGCILFSTFKLLCMQFGQTRIPYKWNSSNNPKMKTNALAWTMNCSPDSKGTSAFIDKKNVCGKIGDLLLKLRQHIRHPTDTGNLQNTWPVDDLSHFPVAPAIVGNVQHRRQMPLEEAEALVKQWQDIKAEALGPDHQIQALSEVLAESMLSQWQTLADSAKTRSCFWRFVLLQLSILRADILSDGVGSEMAEIEAVVEEAAELVDGSQPKNPNYYSTYKIHYILRRQADDSWRFCRGGIQNPV